MLPPAASTATATATTTFSSPPAPFFCLLWFLYLCVCAPTPNLYVQGVQNRTSATLFYYSSPVPLPEHRACVHAVCAHTVHSVRMHILTCTWTILMELDGLKEGWGKRGKEKIWSWERDVGEALGGARGGRGDGVAVVEMIETRCIHA